MRSARMFAAASDAYRRLAEAQERLLESERERSVTETVGALNHEVNNPLAAIAGNAQLLLRHPEILEPGVRDKIETILESARRIQRVTARMSTLIQATTMPYPGERGILDVRNSIARGDAMPIPPPAGEATDAA
jgi:nitrogen-specific signal transduction histidine kinase